jgi:hypothetical protein
MELRIMYFIALALLGIHKRWRAFAMTRNIIILLLIAFKSTAFAQEKQLTADSDTVFWYRYYDPIRKLVGLRSPDSVNSDFYFRFWDIGSVLEIERKDGRLTGRVTHIVRQIKRNELGRTYFKATTLTEKTVYEIYDLLNKYHIVNLPTDERIEGWEQGLDGVVYIIETSDLDSYSYKHYWTPKASSDKLDEARRLVDFIEASRHVDELRSIGEKFMQCQPFTSYSLLGSGTIITKIKNRG